MRVGDPNVAGGLIQSGDPTVLVNGRPIATAFSPVTPHAPFKGPHLHAQTTSKDFQVLVNGVPVTTSGTIDTCGHPRIVGSVDVIIGGL